MPNRPLAPYHGSAAIQRALDHVGKAYPEGWCQKFTNEIFLSGSVGDWDGDKAADAEDGWKKAKAKGQVVTADKIKYLKDIPGGVMLYWLGGSRDHGHAAVGIGDGMMVSTDLPTSGRIGKVAISMASERWGLSFAGYVIQEGNGYLLIDPDSVLPGHIRIEAGPKKGHDYRSPSTVSVTWINDRRKRKWFSRHIWFLQHWLNMAGYKYGTPTGYFDDRTQTLYDKFRTEQGYRGADAKGAVGITSLNQLRTKAHAAKKVSK